MTVDTRTLVRVRRRIEKLVARPPMFHEVWTPVVLGRRRARILAWMGLLGRAVTAEYLDRPTLSVESCRKWSRQQ